MTSQTSIVLVYDQDCPNVDGCRAALRAALRQIGGSCSWEEWDRNSDETPPAYRSFGSPTVLVNGRDICVQKGGDTPEGNSCRVYADGSGGMSGVPPVKSIVGALMGNFDTGGSATHLSPLPDVSNADLHCLSESVASTAAGRKQVAAGFGAIGAAVLASLCCIGPVLFVTLGVGAGLAARFEPLRPLFTVVTLALLAIGFYTVYVRKPRRSGVVCGGDGVCDSSRDRSRDRRVLWVTTVVAIVVLTFPQWSVLFL